MNKYKLLLSCSALLMSIGLSACGAQEHVHEWEEPTYAWNASQTECVATRVCKEDAEHVEKATATISIEHKTPATCEADGVDVIVAKFAEEWAAKQSKDTVLTKIGHNWGVPTYSWSADLAKCTATRVCLNDGSHKETANGTIAVDHKIVPTCTTGGLDVLTASFTETWASAQSTNKYLTAGAHSWGQPTYTWASDNSFCYATRVCANDASHKETSIAAVEVDHTTVPTCLAGGKDTYTATFTDAWAATQTKEIELGETGHNWDLQAWYDWNDLDKSNPNCVAHHKCLNCSKVENAFCHNPTKTTTTEATCETAGKETLKATFTETWAEPQWLIGRLTAPLGHSWGNPTYEWKGNGACVATRVCTRDASHKETVVGTVSSQITPATCEEEGEETYTATFAETWASTQTKNVDVDALDHNWGAQTYEWNEDNTECTATRVCLNDSTHIQTATTDNIEEVIRIPATCTSIGASLFYAYFDDPWVIEPDKYDLTPKLNHTLDVAGTCTVCNTNTMQYYNMDQDTFQSMEVSVPEQCTSAVIKLYVEGEGDYVHLDAGSVDTEVTIKSVRSCADTEVEIVPDAVGYYALQYHQNYYVELEFADPTKTGYLVMDRSGYDMYIEDVFTVPGRGTAVCGVLEDDITIGDTVYYTNIATGTRETTIVWGIDKGKNQVDEAFAGDDVALFLRGVSVNEILVGSLLAW